MKPFSSQTQTNDGNLTTPPNFAVAPSVKPTSRARIYRIPNTSDAAAAANGFAGGANGAVVAESETGNSGGGAPESFLWATREIAALDFLMNVPLRSEKDIVRAGLSGGRWHHDARQSADSSRPSSCVGVDENKDWGVPAPEDGRSLRLTNFDVSGGSGAEEDATATGTESSINTRVLEARGEVSEHNKSQAAAGGRWWEKLILKDKRFFSVANQQAQRREQLELEEKELERPTESPSLVMLGSNAAAGGVAGGVVDVTGRGSTGGAHPIAAAAATVGVPGRRLDGREAVDVVLPEEFRCRPPPLRAAARKAALREWEMRVAYGARQDPEGRSRRDPVATPRNALLDGRVFLSAKKSYPIAVFSTIKYEPKKEETLRRRKQLEELGGGGTQFVLPERDWRGVSYRSLLPIESNQKQNKAFNRLLRGNTSPLKKRSKKISSPRDRVQFDRTPSSGDEDDDSSSMSSSDESDRGGYIPGFLDDPQMVQGRNRNVMMGDKVTGPIISSTIQFVKPSVLKADLNKQFRERFDQWEPPKMQRKYIGARVLDGVYTLIDPTETIQEDDGEQDRHRSGSITAEHKRETIRMPPSLTLSKIRSLKQQALVACVRARIEISTLALACIHFERLCLDCRVDKSNRRLSFAACLLLAAKVNESNSMIAYDRGVETKSDGSQLPLMTSWVKPNRKSGKIFESLIFFFTHDWSLSLKQLYAAEWIVFTALGFSLKAKPSEVAFHFKRLLRVLEWNPRSYLGPEMYRQWQESLAVESRHNERRKTRHEARIKRNERKLLKLQRKLHLKQQTEDLSGRSIRRSSTTVSDGAVNSFRRHSVGSASMSVGSSIATSAYAGTSESHPEEMHLDSPGRLPRNPRKAEGAAIRGILSRLSRPKQFSHGKDLDKLPKQDLDKLPKPEKKVVTSLTQSSSVPNLPSLDSKTNDSTVNSHIIKHDDESCHSDH